MNTKIIKDEINWLLEAINEQYEAIYRHSEKIPQIEFDILMENVRKFYENMHLLQRLNDPMAFPEKKKKSGDSVPETTRPAPVSPVSEPETPVDTVIEPQKPVQAQVKPTGPAPVHLEKVVASKKSVNSPEIDLFASEEPAFSIKLKEAREKTFGPKIPAERIENLKAAISINEKFMFINELFDGNLREYNETIETLNGFKTIDQAADFLDLMLKKNFWNTGSNAFKKLKELVERRF
ncbi:MAG: hypothetical protein Q8M08_08575 [Bacteroidales bacterium]|nr:hypothetical protein [Bacteroidales bacterium]